LFLCFVVFFQTTTTPQTKGRKEKKREERAENGFVAFLVAVVGGATIHICLKKVCCKGIPPPPHSEALHALFRFFKERL
jgi:hypothetical protein